MDSPKTIQDPKKVVESLLNLSKELLENSEQNDGQVIIDGQIIAWKINSCLYSEYPHNFKQRR